MGGATAVSATPDHGEAVLVRVCSPSLDDDAPGPGPAPAPAPAAAPADGPGGVARGSRLRLGLVTVDAVAAATAWVVVLAAPGALAASPAKAAATVVCATAVTLLVADLRGLYLSRVCSVRSVELAELLRVAAAGGLAGFLADQALANGVRRGGAVLAVLLLFLCMAAGRSAFDDWLKHRRSLGLHCRSVVFLGMDHELGQLHTVLAEHPELGYRVLGFLGRPGTGAATALPCLGSEEDAVEVVRRLGASGVIVASSCPSSARRTAAVRALLATDVHVQVSPGLSGIGYWRVRTHALGHAPLLYLERVASLRWRDRAKRAIDLAVAPLLLVAASPILLVAALAIRLDDHGPVLYRQERIGLGGRPFGMWKLRTMAVGADAQAALVAGENQRTGPLFKSATDSRVTRVGRVLRLLSIDELPQLVNVLRGTMTLVGPRPALATEVAEFDADLLRRHDVRPGLTGLWQLEARDNPSFGAYRRLDLFYIDNWSFALDLIILLLTAHSVAIRAARALAGRAADLVARHRSVGGGEVRPATVRSLDG